MKKLAALLLMWFVTWKEFVSSKSYNLDGFSSVESCVIQEEAETRFFPTKEEAKSFIRDSGGNRKQWDFKLFEVIER